ncbi:YchJ family protein [Uliginosibacterium sp. H1]|uniref:YchJ family protein n=1 Tax=Uliginosibacterium sp. H1 TaxID=3114757 RepID=UPI002E1901B3|nr:YchJ family metal-binding protein [Uliginosibacterium sp. H1]
MPARPEPAKQPCPCGLPATYAACCGRYHGGETAPTPEALMRSRYSAYALGIDSYLLSTWHASTRPAELGGDGSPKWIGLRVLSSALQDDHHGTVDFEARCRIGGRAERLREHSRFVREDGRWYYVDGDHPG